MLDIKIHRSDTDCHNQDHYGVELWNIKIQLAAVKTCVTQTNTTQTLHDACCDQTQVSLYTPP